MATPLERMRTAWKTEGRLALHRVVEEMAREGVTRAALDGALDALLDETRAAGADDEAEEEILGVGDRLSGWCLASQRIKALPATSALPPAEANGHPAPPPAKSTPSA